MRVFASTTGGGDEEGPAARFWSPTRVQLPPVPGAERGGCRLRLQVERVGDGVTIVEGEIDQVDGVVGLVEDVCRPRT